MVYPFDENNVAVAVQNRLFNDPARVEILENLINISGIGKDYLNISSCELIVFFLSPKQPIARHKPIVERLVLIIPESFSFEWKLLVGGYFHVKYKSIPEALPQQVKSLSLLYSGVAVASNKSILFKNEKVSLI